MSEEQKDYFNIAGGFYDDLTKENKATVLKKEKKHSNKDKNKKKTSFIKPLLSVAQRNLYNDMSKAHFKALEKGIQLPITGSFKEVFPTYYNHQIVTKKRLDDRISRQNNPHELQDIVDSIQKLL